MADPPGGAVGVDGRQRRGERSREKMVRALYELVGEGVLTPTAQQVASRAGVGLRTVFRHFKDMDTLFAEMDRLLRSEAAELFADRAPPAAPVVDRGLDLARLRMKAYARLEPYLRATRLHRARSPFLQKQSASMVRDVRRALQTWLPELKDAPADLFDALVVTLSFETWDTLRGDDELSRPRTRAAMERMVRTLVADLDGGAGGSD